MVWKNREKHSLIRIKVSSYLTKTPSRGSSCNRGTTKISPPTRSRTSSIQKPFKKSEQHPLPETLTVQPRKKINQPSLYSPEYFATAQVRKETSPHLSLRRAANELLPPRKFQRIFHRALQRTARSIPLAASSLSLPRCTFFFLAQQRVGVARQRPPRCTIYLEKDRALGASSVSFMREPGLLRLPVGDQLGEGRVYSSVQPNQRRPVRRELESTPDRGSSGAHDRLLFFHLFICLLEIR